MNSILFGMPGAGEWIVILVVVLILFGGRKIPQLAKDLGSGIREFRKSLSDATKEDEHGQISSKEESLPIKNTSPRKKKKA